MDQNKNFMFKIITAGYGGVGKTTLLHRYIEDRFLLDTKMTIGVEFFDKTLIHKDKHVTLQLWDFGGQERFRFFLDSFVVGASGAFLMFDITNFESFEALNEWIKIVRKHNQNLPVILLGSKCDLIGREGLAFINESEINEFMENHNIDVYLKISSKTGENIEEAFKTLLVQVFESKGLDC